MNFDTISDLLGEKKSGAVVSVAPTDSVADAVKAMNEVKIGAVVVLDRQKLAGIFTERDVLVRVVGGGRDPQATRVSDVMTSSVQTVGPATTIDDAMQMMSSKRFRHVPVLDQGEVCGLISMGDVTRWVIKAQDEQVDSAIRAVKQMAHSNRRG